jgi:predicted nucleotidyltransferase
MELARDFSEFIDLLNKHGLDYLVVGGYALGFHGRPRYTGDLDIWIDISEKNAAKMVHVIDDFGFATLGLEKEDFLEKGYVTQIGYPPLRIDILNDIDGVVFKEAYKNKQVIDIEGILVNYIGYNDLILNKEASGRDKDIADIKSLKKAKPKGGK